MQPKLQGRHGGLKAGGSRRARGAIGAAGIARAPGLRSCPRARPHESEQFLLLLLLLLSSSSLLLFSLFWECITGVVDIFKTRTRHGGRENSVLKHESNTGEQAWNCICQVADASAAGGTQRTTSLECFRSMPKNGKSTILATAPTLQKSYVAFLFRV